MNNDHMIEMIKNKEVTTLKTVRSRRCIECCIILNPGDRVHEIDCYRVDNNSKRHPLATRYMCEFCNMNDTVNISLDTCESPKEESIILESEQSIQEEISIIDKILNWFKQF